MTNDLIYSTIVDLIHHLRWLENTLDRVTSNASRGDTHDDGISDGLSYAADALDLIVAGKSWRPALYNLTASLASKGG